MVVKNLRLSAMIFLTILTCIFGISSEAAGYKTELKISAVSAVLMDYATGQVLFQKNALEHRAPASTTKILTAIMAIEKEKLNHVIVAHRDASVIGGSSIYLKAGETHSLQELLYGILLNSGNDASVAVAEDLAGSESKFAEWMTAKAQQIGAKNSHFVNSNGLPQKGHYSTAYDLALIARYALHNPIFTDMVRTKTKLISWPGHPKERFLINHNKLLWQYQFADGVKTGYTDESGKCLVSSATQNNHRLIAVVLKSRDMYGDSKNLLEYGFRHYELLNVATQGKKISQIAITGGIASQVPVLPDRSVNLVIPRGTEKRLQIKLALNNPIKAPVFRHQKVGELVVKFGEKLMDRVPLVTMASVPQKGIWRQFWEWLTKILSF